MMRKSLATGLALSLIAAALAAAGGTEEEGGAPRLLRLR